MAKRILISFNSSLEYGVFSDFSYTIKIGEVNLIYTSGETAVSISYNNTEDLPPNEIKIYASLQDNIYKTLEFLNTYYYSPIITYTVIENSIEVYVDSEEASIIGLNSNNIGIVVSYENVNVIVEGEIKLKYLLQYSNIVNDNYKLEIYQVGYTGTSKDISGTVSIEKGGVKNHLDAVRGTSLYITLEADETLTLEDLYSKNELDYPVKFYKNGKLIFRGFITPSGVTQSFTREIWRVSFDCMDGLGYLDNLSFVRENGLQFTDRMDIQDILFYCLRRTGMLQKINTYVDVFYDGYADLENRNIFESTMIDTTRFVKKDNNTIMSCGEVMRSVLDIFNAVITQHDGEWYIYRPNDIYRSSYVTFKKYNISNLYENSVLVNLNKVIGSQINNFYPHHAMGDQQISIRGSISAYRINYKYGFLQSTLPNSALKHDALMNYPNWTVSRPDLIINDPLLDRGVKSMTLWDPDDPTPLIMSSDNIYLLKDSNFLFKTTTWHTNALGLVIFKIRLGPYYMTKDGQWTTTDTRIVFNLPGYVPNGTYTDFNIQSDKLPIESDLFVEIYQPAKGFEIVRSTPVLINSVNIIVNTAQQENVVGEFHTVQRPKISSNVKENKEVYNGDSGDVYFEGAIFKLGGAELTTTWHRKNFIESKPILRISAEDALRISQTPMKEFSGSFYGYLPYLSVFEIEGLSGKFMPIEYSYDTFTNIGRFKLLELFARELPDIKYNFTFDYGNTVKPTITS